MSRLFRGILRLSAVVVSLFCLFLDISCSAYVRTGARVNDFVAAGDLSRARNILETNENAYGAGNRLLYLFDKGYLEHLSGDYGKSIVSFDKAKKEYERLYTQSLSRIVGTFLVNDYLSPYRGEDFERIMVNIFQTLNYLQLNNQQEALVEARDADEELRLLNNRYPPGQKNVYKEDAFARLLMGILYESSYDREGYNNAYISYAKAAEIYENDYLANYGVASPVFLKENLFAAAAFMGREEMDKCRLRYGNIKFLSLEEKKSKAEVYFIQYDGRMPSKTEVTIPIVLPDGYIVPLVFPRYAARSNPVDRSRFLAQRQDNRVFYADTEIGENISAIAEKNLDNRKARVIAKVMLSSAGKYFAEKAAERQIRGKYGDNTGNGFSILSSLFNIFSNRADLRAWETLPARIRVARLILEPGEYSLFLNNIDQQERALGQISLGRFAFSAGDKKFIICRSIVTLNSR